MKLEYISSRGDALTLTDNEWAYLISVDGQTQGNADVSSVVIGTIDGDTVNNMRATPRTLILTLKIKNGVNVEDAKRQITKVIKLKQSGSLLWTQNGRTTKIDGYVESVEMPRWEHSVAMQITLHCGQPFWEDVDYIVRELTGAINLHYFTDVAGDMLYFPAEGIPLGEYDFIRTKQFRNNGDVEVGLEIEIVAFATVTNPIIYDGFGNFFGIGYGTGSKKIALKSGETINIITTKGNKTVLRNNEVNLLDKIKPQSTWLQLAVGDNSFTVNSDDKDENNMSFNLSYKQRYI